MKEWDEMAHERTDSEQIKKQILALTRVYAEQVHACNRPASARDNTGFKRGVSKIPYAARVFTEDEVEAAVSSALDFWLTLGSEGDAMQQEFATYLGVRHSLLVNSGSSANLIAISALTSPKLPLERRVTPGDEVITCAAGFPTTVAPIIQCGAVPVFIDNEPVTGNACVDQIESAIVNGKTKAIMMAHTLGNPFDIASVLEVCQRYDLWLVEDNCDSLGSTYTMPLSRACALGLDHLIKIARQGTHPIICIELVGRIEMLTAPTGAFGDLSTQSFYPPHHMTMGEGGAVNIIRDARLKPIVESFRDWGRDCWCPSGVDNTCNKRYGWQLGELPMGYDHKYIYSHLGYNVKPLDLQAAIGRVQLRRLPEFVEARKKNWERLRCGLANLTDHFEFALPTHSVAWRQPSRRGKCHAQPEFVWNESGCRSQCSWFGFMVLVRQESALTNTTVARELDRRGIGNRMLFGGNLVRQPAFVRLRRDYPGSMRVPADLPGADRIMNEAIFIGTFPGLLAIEIDYIIESLHDIVRLA